MAAQLCRGAACLLLGGAAAALAADPAALLTGGGRSAESEPPAEAGPRLGSEVLQKKLVFGVPGANSFTATSDASFIITFVFNMVFLGAIAVAVANAAQQAGAAASSRRRDRLHLGPVPLERRTSPLRHRRRHTATLAPDTVHAIVAHVSDPAPAATAPAATAATAAPAAAPAAAAASDASSADYASDYGTDYGGDYGGYQRYPSRYDDRLTAAEKRIPSSTVEQSFNPSSVEKGFKPSSVADILDYLYETDRSLYDALQLKVARQSAPPQRGAEDREYADYLASVYGYGGLKRDRDGYGALEGDRDGYGALEGDRDGYGALEGDRDGYGALEGDRGGWQTDQKSARLSSRAAGQAGLSGKVPYEKEDPLGAPHKFHQRIGDSGAS